MKSTICHCFAFFLGLTLFACSVGPNYEGRPNVGHSEKFAGAGLQPSAPDLDRWWRKLGSRELNGLVENALTNHPDVNIAGQRLREARAMRRQVASAILPQAGANASFARLNPGTITGGGGLGDAAGLAGSFSFDDPIEYWNSGIDISWEIDVFGGLKHRERSAAARAQAIQEQLHGVRQALAAEVAETYFTIAGMREQLAAVEQQLALQKSQTDDVRDRVDAGASSRLDLDRSLARLENTRTQLPTLEAGISTQVKRLALLLGDRPDALDREEVADRSLPEKLPMARTGLPAELILRRPDLREAERNLAGATEEIGVAVADFYPKFRIGNTGPTSFGAQPSDLFDASGYVFQFGPRVDWKIFDGGANRAALEQADARQKIALLEYEKSVLHAIGEVETELANLSAESRRLQIVQRARKATADAVRRVRENHEAGAAPQVDVLIEEQALRDVEISEIRAKSQMLQVWIRLHKALGGGWK
jgi:NodT family efflux transporter outer membrane factor (OMF) lipoprotein